MILYKGYRQSYCKAKRGSNRDEQEPRTLNIIINSEALKNLNTRTVSQNSKELNYKSQDNDTVCQKNVTVQMHMILMLLFKKFIYFVAVTTDLFSFFLSYEFVSHGMKVY